MAVRTLNTLLEYFQRGDRPTEGQFKDLIESTLQNIEATNAGLTISGSQTQASLVTIPYNDINFWEDDGSGNVSLNNSQTMALGNAHQVDKILDTIGTDDPLALVTEKAVQDYVRARTTSIKFNAYRNTSYTVQATGISLVPFGFPLDQDGTPGGGYSTSQHRFVVPTSGAGSYEFSFNTVIETFCPGTSNSFVALEWYASRGGSQLFRQEFYRIPGLYERTGVYPPQACYILNNGNGFSVSSTKTLSLTDGDIVQVRIKASGADSTFSGGASQTNFTGKLL